ncbi:PREDICTED: hemicentin-2-like [Branchiostoma belcheri]|uniref:Hemicentin-2-like n=1 Tax=Branchiostoma belcheri TaxID=7741 RepID=A0A6P4YJ74_BRABE|nr:PREDICTED: hemicentin-2-like [Branchiostoma belcheri]
MEQVTEHERNPFIDGVSYNAVPLHTAVLLGHTATLHCSFNDLSADDVPPTLRGAEIPGKAGKQMELSCTSSGGHPPAQLTWYNGTEAVTGQHVIQKESEGRVELDLILRRLTKWDNGMNLTCRASQPFPEITSAQDSWTVLQVYYPPSVTVPVPSVRVVEGVTADLTCLVESNPPATIRWTRPGHSALPNDNIGQKIFRIPSTSHQDAGVYQCTADNGVQPVAVGTVTLEVLYPPLINPSMDDKVTALQDDDDFSLNCLVEGNPKPKVMWRRKNTKLHWKNPLRFNRVRYDVEGTYQCVGISDGFPQTTKDVFVDVLGKPYMEGEEDTTMPSAYTGETLRLGCTVEADPLPPRINWIWRNNYGQETELDDADFRIVTTRRNQEMTSSLTIQNVAMKDSGSYICKTTNMFGSAKRDMHLEVKESAPNLVIITSITAGGVLVVTVAVILVVIAKKKGWICKSHLDALRPMPPVPKYVYNTGTIDSGVEDLQELQEMYGTLKPRPPPRMEKKWESVGLSYSVDGVSYNAVPLPTAVLLGHTATLHCSFHNLSPEDVVNWLGPPRLTQITSGRRVDPKYPRHQVVGDEKKGEFHLLIQDAHLEDGGTYTCCIFGLTPKEAKLTVVDPPLINPSMYDKVTALQDDGDFSLNCLVEGNPKPKVTWRRKNTKLYWKNPLRFNRVRYDVEGTYQCVGTSDGFPQTTKDVFVDVLGKPYMDGEGDTAMLSVDTGETVRLGCTVAADPLPSRINWIWRNNYGQETDLDNADFDIVTSRRNQEMTSTLTLQNVAVNDSGSYICETTNMFGSAKRDMHLEVKEPPNLVMITSNQIKIKTFVTAGVLLVVTVAVIFIVIAKKKGWICKSHLDDSFDLSASRPMPPGTIDSDVEGLQELQEMYGTLKPRPPPRMKKWESVGLSYSGLVHSTSLQSYSTEEQ